MLATRCRRRAAVPGPAGRRLTGQAGTRQFLDVGCGLPTSPNPYDLLPGARVAYVDVDPRATARARERLAGNELTTVIEADLRHPSTVLAAAGTLLDLSRPAGLLLVACLHNIPGADDPAGIVARYLPVVPPGPAREPSCPGPPPRETVGFLVSSA